jgi:hypothetical protein
LLLLCTHLFLQRFINDCEQVIRTERVPFNVPSELKELNELVIELTLFLIELVQLENGLVQSLNQIQLFLLHLVHVGIVVFLDAHGDRTLGSYEFGRLGLKWEGFYTLILRNWQRLERASTSGGIRCSRIDRCDFVTLNLTLEPLIHVALTLFVFLG